jgi:hypothetical protein
MPTFSLPHVSDLNENINMTKTKIQQYEKNANEWYPAIILLYQKSGRLGENGGTR